LFYNLEVLFIRQKDNQVVEASLIAYKNNVFYPLFNDKINLNSLDGGEHVNSIEFGDNIIRQGISISCSRGGDIMNDRNNSISSMCSVTSNLIDLPNYKRILFF
jgi:hypothetical protein